MSEISTMRVKAHIAKRFKDIHSAADVARDLAINWETLRKCFLRIERIPLHDYIAEVRVAEMQELLRTTDLSCMAVCLECGCREDVGARLFKRHTGITMKQFRDKCHGESYRSLGKVGLGQR